MMKVIISLFIIVSALFGASSESKILKLIFDSLYENRSFSIYTDDEQKAETLKEASIKISSNCHDADIVYASEFSDKCAEKPLFTDNYKTFKNSENSIGAFYWSKGRPNILFLKYRLERHGLRLSEELEKYEMDAL
ncbi:MAG: hypothetical protein WC667_05655 [Sulfurimonas sp.]|jgi:hypothetical protein